jgi:hypothetical protein
MAKLSRRFLPIPPRRNDIGSFNVNRKAKITVGSRLQQLSIWMQTDRLWKSLILKLAEPRPQGTHGLLQLFNLAAELIDLRGFLRLAKPWSIAKARDCQAKRQQSAQNRSSFYGHGRLLGADSSISRGF